MSTIWKIAQRVDSFEKSFGFFLLELSYLLKEFVDLRKKMLKDDPIDPSNLGESIQKADKDMNNRKIVNLAKYNWQRRPSKQEMCWWKYTNKSILFPFLSNQTHRNLFETLIKEIARSWYHTGQNSNSEDFHYNKYSVTASNQPGLNNYATKKIKFHPEREYPLWKTMED